MSWTSRALHTILFLLFPILTLVSLNLSQIRIGDAGRSILISLTAGLLLLLTFRVLFRSWEKAALATSLAGILFFSYGHAYLWLKGTSATLGRHRYLIPLFVAAFALPAVAMARQKRPLQGITRSLNLIASIAILIPLLSILIAVLRAGPTSLGSNLVIRDAAGQVPRLGSEPPPDIYLIVMDAYARSDQLREEYGYDNAGFEQHLEEQGFFIAGRSLANYAHTALSLASTLNLSYFDELGVDLDRTGFPEGLRERLIHSFARTQLESMGYATISLKSGYQYTELLDAEKFVTAAPVNALRYLNPFEYLLIQTSGGRLIIDAAVALSLVDPLSLRTPFRAHRETVLAEFDALEQVAHYQSPKFVFAHFISPHEPYLFGPNGEARQPGGVFTFADQGDAVDVDLERRLYLDQLIYVTKRLEEALDAILSHSDVEPIIVLMSDHGPDTGVDWGHISEEDISLRMPILNTYLLPARCRDSLYPEISPVNSFRVVFNCAFGSQYELLPDHSYFSGWVDIDRFERVDTRLR